MTEEVEEVLFNAEEKMEKTMSALRDNFASVRTGRASAMLLDRIRVDYYGVPTPINQMAGVKIPEAHLLVIEPWDKTQLKPIEKVQSLGAHVVGVNCSTGPEEMLHTL